MARVRVRVRARVRVRVSAPSRCWRVGRHLTAPLVGAGALEGGVRMATRANAAADHRTWLGLGLG